MRVYSIHSIGATLQEKPPTNLGGSGGGLKPGPLGCYVSMLTLWCKAAQNNGIVILSKIVWIKYFWKAYNPFHGLHIVFFYISFNSREMMKYFLYYFIKSLYSLVNFMQMQSYLIV